MKIKLLFITIFIVALSSAAFPQSVVVTGKKVTYTRKKPISSYKKRFSVTYPKVRASTPALSRKIETALTYEKILGINIKEELTEVQWLEEADYTVDYNRNGLLVVTLSMEGSGAYPSGDSKIVVIDIKSGTRVRPSDVFVNLASLTAKVRKMQEMEIAETIAAIKKDADSSDVNAIDLFAESAEYHKLKLDQFVISDKGVTFHHDYAFAHVVKALQPDGQFFMSWTELKPYIKPAGLLSRIAR